MSERLQKLLAAAGHGSRRQIEQWIRAGRLSVDGHVAALGERADPGADIRLDGAPLAAAAAGALTREVLIYHKPMGEVTTRSDPKRRPTVFERLPAPASGRWVVVGRLDVNTTGLLLFTNDGALAHRLMHPSSEVEREYRVRVSGQPAAGVLASLRAGLMLEDGPARFDSLVRERAEPNAAASSFRVTLREGRNREVRRLWQAAGLEVLRLQRLRYGAVRLPSDLRPGQYRQLSPDQAAQL
ncbi:MAG: pseudouridine synthase [Steroidobacteraceae bacterium]